MHYNVDEYQRIRTLLFLFVLLICTPGLSQDLKTKKRTDGPCKEIYTVDKKTKARHGTYVKLRASTKDTLVRGMYDNDRQSGVWKYYGDGGEMHLEYDYDNGEMVYLSEQMSRVDSFPVRSGGEFVFSEVEMPPVYLGYKDEVQLTIQSNIRPSKRVLENGISGMSMASFVVDTNGRMKDVKIESAVDKTFEAQILKTIALIDGKWVPAKLNNEPVESQIFILFDIQFLSTSSAQYRSTYREQPYLYVIELLLFGVMRH